MPQEFNPSRRELKQLLRVLKKGFRTIKPEDLAPSTRCPDSWTMASYVAGEVDPGTQETINAHIAFCKSCFEDYVALAGAEGIAKFFLKERTTRTEELAKAHWRELLDRLKTYVIDLGKTYGPGALVGSVRIVTERLAYAAEGPQLELWHSTNWEKNRSESYDRGFKDQDSKHGGDFLDDPLAHLTDTMHYKTTIRDEGRVAIFSKLLEISVGANAYRVALSPEREGSVSCDTAGHLTPLKVPLSVSVHSETGYELISTQTDESGNGHFVIPSRSGELRVLTLNLQGSEQQILFRLPREEKSDSWNSKSKA